MVGTEAPASCESRRQQLLPPPTAGRASPRLYIWGAMVLQHFTSCGWQADYDPRGGAVNSRLAGGLGFERPGIRGLANMRLRVTMALTITLALAHTGLPG